MRVEGGGSLVGCIDSWRLGPEGEGMRVEGAPAGLRAGVVTRGILGPLHAGCSP